MSYQPDPPAGAQPSSPFAVPPGPPPPPVMSPQGAAPQSSYGVGPASPAPTAAGRRKGLLFTGAAIAALGVGAGIVLIALSGSAKEETVKRFARAPVGCTTTLEFEKSATFTLYIETEGSIGAVDGDCAAGGTTYQRTLAELPRVSLTLLNSSDQEVTMTPADSPSYAEGNFAGRAYQRVDIDEPGTFRLTVTSDDTDFAIAIGGKPDADAEAMSLGGVGAATIGLLLGGLLMVLGMRKKKPAPPTTPSPSSPAMWQPTPAPTPGWQPQPTAPVGYPPAPPVPMTPQRPAAPPVPGQTGPGWGAPQQQG